MYLNAWAQENYCMGTTKTAKNKDKKIIYNVVQHGILPFSQKDLLTILECYIYNNLHTC